MEKGQSNLMEYILSIFFSLIVLLAVASIIYSFYNNALKQDITKSLNEVDSEVSSAIYKIYQQGKASSSSPANSTSVLLANVNLNLPSRVTNRNYEVDLISINPLFATVSNVTIGGSNVSTLIQSFGAKIVAKTTDDPKIVVSKDLTNIDAAIQGTFINGINTTLKYYRYNFNGTIYDKIILGEQQIIIDITQMS
jgi:hypothetical protein